MRNYLEIIFSCKKVNWGITKLISEYYDVKVYKIGLNFEHSTNILKI